MILDKILTTESLGGDFARIKDTLDKKQNCSVFCRAKGARWHISALQEKFFVYVAANSMEARDTAQALSEIIDDEIVYIPHKEEILLYSKSHKSKTLPERLEAIYKILSGKVKGCVISAEGLTQYFPSKERFLALSDTFYRGMDIDLEKFTSSLAKSGYERVSTVDEKGTFSIRGDIIDIWASQDELPTRIELFGDTIESIKLFAYDTQMSLKAIDRITIIPNTDLLISESKQMWVLQTLEELYDKVSETSSHIMLEIIDRFKLNPYDASLVWLIPFLKNELSTLFDYLTEDSVIIYDDSMEVESALKRYYELHNIRCDNFIKSGEILIEHKSSCLDYKSLENYVARYVKLAFSSQNIVNPLFESNKVYNINCTPSPFYYKGMTSLVGDVVNFIKSENRVLIYSGSKFAQNAINTLFVDNDIKAHLLDTFQSNEITILPYRIKHGFVYHDHKIAVIGTDDIGRPKVRRDKIRAHKEDAVLPQEGHYVVHERYGIGLSEGIKTLETASGKRDYYVVKYANDDKLYIPAENIDSIELYLGEGKPKLHNLNGTEFEKVKERVKGSVKKMAIDLLKLYEKRNSLKGFKYNPDTPWQAEMEENFEFTPTDDQIVATSEIKEDMEKGKIMDRLLCGDVGFGKTEVAIRAIFKTVLDGKQACILAPTTILAEQHYNTVKSRLEEYHLNVELLSRFASSQSIKKSLELIKQGVTNIIVGTHRVLSKDVEFFDLGLLVLDEEQRFGVEHKEKIKLLKNNVNVLTLSATPIPRTLHMALSGIRDISTLDTPPQNRHPIETFVTEYSETLLVDAVLREVSRNGQVFILYNRVESIENFYKRVITLLGNDIKVIYVHGQMKSEYLEKQIRAFYEKQADVMISTTIIENGIDIPDANTLIVIDADKLGLSQLYQIRGRVGRSHNLAFAYLTYDSRKILTENAVKRLKAITEFTSLGSGFKIAKQDLMIRGAGNVIGREQHGNLGKVGYDMFSRLIKESVEELRGNEVKKKNDLTLNVMIETSIPREYISDNTERVKIYKRISLLKSLEMKNNLTDEIRDIYGKIPQSTLSLIDIGLIKNLALELDISGFIIKKTEAKITFLNNSCYNRANLMNALSDYSDTTTFLANKTPEIIFKFKNENERENLAVLIDFLLKSVR